MRRTMLAAIAPQQTSVRLQVLMSAFVFVALSGSLFVGDPFDKTFAHTAPTVPPLTISMTVDNVSLAIRATDLPSGIFDVSPPSNVAQGATAISLHPFQSFTIRTIPFGQSAVDLGLPAAKSGEAAQYMALLQSRAGNQGALGEFASIFGHRTLGMVYRSHQRIPGTPKMTLVATEQWVSEGGNRIWIVTSSHEGNVTSVPFVSNLVITSSNPNQPTTLGIQPPNHSLTNSTEAVAQSLPTYSLPWPHWWSGDCNVNNAPPGYLLTTGTGALNGLQICAPSASKLQSQVTPPSKGIWVSFDGYGAFQWQCVELSLRYMDVAWGVKPYTMPDAYGIADSFPFSSYSSVSEVENGTVGRAPQPGDVLQLSTNGSNPDPGHTGVVESSSVDSNGNGSIELDSENGSLAGRYSVPVSNWIVGGDGVNSTTAWLHYGGTPTQSTYKVAFQANTSDLFTVGMQPANGTDMLEGMMSGTNPSIATLSGGGHEIAFQANNTDLVTVGDQPATGVDTHMGMAAGTSPSIAALSGGGYEIAFQANTGQLWVTGTAGTQDLQFGMMSGTSPAIAPLPNGGYEIAFQSNVGQLWITGPAGAGAENLQFGMKNDTNPAITELANGGYEVAFQANTGDLYTVGTQPAAGVDMQEGMMAGTSPSISAVGNSYEIAFQANTGDLFTVGTQPANGTDMLEGMKAGTSPSIIAFGSAYEIAIEANTNDLFTVGTQPAHGTDMLEGMMAGTSPSITAG